MVVSKRRLSLKNQTTQPNKKQQKLLENLFEQTESVTNGLSNRSDSELIALLKSDDHAAFAEIYKRYWKKLFTLAANKIADFSEAEDIVQQVFISIWERRAEIEIVSTLSSYLAVAIKYRVFKGLAKASKRAHFSTDEAAEQALNVLDDSTQNWLEFQEVRSRLGRLVDTLPEKCRLVYPLTREQGFSQKQVAAELAISEKTVQAHMNRAYKTLKTGLRGFFHIL